MTWKTRFEKLCDGEPMDSQLVDEAAKLAANSDPDQFGVSFWRFHLRIVQVGILQQLREGAAVGGLFRHMARKAGELADRGAACHS